MQSEIKDQHELGHILSYSGKIISLFCHEWNLMEDFYYKLICSANLKTQEVCIIKDNPILECPATERGLYHYSLESLLTGGKLNIIHFANTEIYRNKNDFAAPDIALYLCELESFNKSFLLKKVTMVTCHLITEQNYERCSSWGASSDIILKINSDGSAMVIQDRVDVS